MWSESKGDRAKESDRRQAMEDPWVCNSLSCQARNLGKVLSREVIGSEPEPGSQSAGSRETIWEAPHNKSLNVMVSANFEPLLPWTRNNRK